MFIILVYEIDSNEEISSKYLEKFIITNLKLKGVKFNNKSRIFHSYIKSLKLYQTIIFENKLPEFLFFKSSNENEIFLEKNYAAVYKKGKLFYYQKLQENSSSKEITQFLEKRLALNISLSVRGDIQIDNTISYSFIKPVKSNIFRYFILYFLILLTSFYFYDWDTKKEKSDLKHIDTVTKNLKEELNFYSVSKSVESLFSLADKNKTKIVFLSLQDSKITLKIEAEKKSKIYDFFKNLNKNSVVNLFYDKEKTRFIGDATFKIYRR